MRWRMTLLALGTLPYGLCGCSQLDGEHPYRTERDHPRRNALLAQKHNAEGLKAIEQGRTEDAENAFREALAADIWYAPAHNNLGLILLERGDAYRAAWEFQFAAKLMPSSALPLNNLGLVFERVGRLEAAADFYTESLQLSADNIETMGHLARTYVKMNRNDQSLRHLLKELAYRGGDSWDVWARRQLLRLGE